MDSTFNNIYKDPNSYYYASSDEEIMEEEYINDSLPEQIDNNGESKQLISQELQQRDFEIQQKISKFQKIYDSDKKLTLEQAETIINELIKDKTVDRLSPLNILFIEVMKVLQQLSRETSFCTSKAEIYLSQNNTLKKTDIKTSEIFDQAAITLHCLFRSLRDQSVFKKEQSDKKNDKIALNNAKEFLTKLKISLISINNIATQINSVESKNLYHTLQRYCDILSHICYNDVFFNKCTDSLSKNEDSATSTLFNPPTSSHMALYLDSLNICLFSMGKYRMKLKNSITSPLAETIKELNIILKPHQKSSEVNNLISTLTKYQKTLEELNDSLPKLVESIIVKASCQMVNKKIKSYFENCQSQNYSTLFIIKELTPLINEILDLWEPFNQELHKTHESDTKKYHEILKETIKSVSTFRANKKKLKFKAKTNNSLNVLLSSLERLLDPQTFTFLQNALITDSIRIPLIIQNEMAMYYNMMNEINEKALNFQQALIPGKALIPCSSFSAIDLLLHQILLFNDVNQENRSPGSRKLEESLLIALNSIAHSIILKINTPKEFSICEEEKNSPTLVTYQKLSIISEGLLEILQHEEYKNNKLNNILEKLTIYLKSFPYPPASLPNLKDHFTQTLFGPLSREEKITTSDIPLIQRHMDLCSYLLITNNVEKDLVSVKKKLKNILKETSDHSAHFLKLNLKNIKLAQLEVNETRNLVTKYSKKLQYCKNTKDILSTLHEWREKMDPFRKTDKGWRLQLSILANIAVEKEEQEIYEAINRISLETALYHFLEMTLTEVLNTNPIETVATPSTKRAPIINNKTPVIIESKKAKFDDKVSKATVAPIEYPQEIYQPSPYERNLTLLDDLRLEHPRPISNLEPSESYIFRITRREELIQNSKFYLTLIEEEKNWNITKQGVPNILQKRQQIDLLLLLELTEKIALSTLRIGMKNSPDTHIASHIEQNSPLINTHNGEYLSLLLLTANKKWFESSDIRPSILRQESELKKAYWFKEEHRDIEGLNHIIKCCEKVWEELPTPQKSKRVNKLVEQSDRYQECLSRMYELKRNQVTYGIPALPAKECEDEFNKKLILLKFAQNISPHCTHLVEENIESIERLTELNNSLNNHSEKENMPLYFLMRSSEIQIGLLSLCLQIALSTIDVSSNEIHPLYLNEEGNEGGRPLMHNHRVDKLWKALKFHLGNAIVDSTLEIADQYLPLFVGDPRYPHPNKTVITDDLLNMQEKVHLLKIIEEQSFLTDEDKKLFSKFLGGEGWLLPNEDKKLLLGNQIMEGIKAQEKKATLSFHLAANILDIALNNRQQ